MSFFNKLVAKFKQVRENSVHYKNSTTKRSMTSSCTMELSSKTEEKKAVIKAEVKDIVKQYFNTPEKLIQYIRTQGVKVYRLKNAEKILSFIGEEEGLITPLKGLKALCLNLIISEKPDFKTNALFIFDVNNTEIYTIARALYKYYGYKNELPGYDYESQEIFKKIYNTKRQHSSPFAGCNIEEMYACKDAIARDMESINFSIELSVEYENSKRAAKKLQKESSLKV